VAKASPDDVATMHADLLMNAIAELNRRIDKTNAKAMRIHGGRACGKHFWCGGYCDRARDLMELKRVQTLELHNALALMAAEKIAVTQNLNDDVLRAIVREACP
jgi:hypothetical protein